MMLAKVALSALVFALFVPGVLVTLPPGGSKWVVVAVHAVLFAVLHHFAMKMLLKVLGKL
jgi:hypothetical protein